MENFGNESSQLNRLLEKHKQLQERSAFKSTYESQATQNNINYFNSVNNNFSNRGHVSHIHQQNIPTAENKVVYVNPNYKPKVYVNPHINVAPPVVNPHFNMVPTMLNPYANMGVNMIPPMMNPYINMMPVVNYANQMAVYPYINAMPSFNHINQFEVHPHFNMMPPVHMHPQVMNSQINMTNVNNNINNDVRHRIAVNPCKNMTSVVNSTNNHIDLESSIHVNPNKLKIRNIQNQIQISQGNVQDSHHTRQSSIQSKSIHVNPKLIKLRSKNLDTPLIPDTQTTTAITASISTSTTDSTVSLCNTTDSAKTETENQLKSSVTCNGLKKKPLAINCNVLQKRSTTNSTKKGSSVKKSPNSSFIAISRRKLIRVKKSPKIAATSLNTPKLINSTRRRLSSTSLKKIKISPIKDTAACSTNQLIKLNSLKPVKNTDLYKNKWYNKVYRSALKSSCGKMIIDSKKLLNANNLVSIGGVIYKSSRNKLTLSNAATSTAKRKTSLTTNSSNQYFVTKDGKKLLKLDSVQRKLNVSPVKLNTSISPVKSYKTNASNKVKQRSLQILRNKMKKNNQPCLLFQKFGFCANQLKGTCPKVHDRNQVALCRNFLQGKCLLDNCPLSHNIGPEKMPTCKYFLEGCCTRDGCPYLHVKVSAKSPICVEFLRGYCPRGNECQNRHLHACPEFDKSGKCSKGKFCPYPHKSQLTETKRFKSNSKRKSITIAKQTENLSINSETIVPNRKRYYDEVPEDLNQKRENLYKNLKIIKKVYAAQSNNSGEAQNGINNEESNISEPSESVNSEEKLEFVCNKPRRPPIGPLPAYIPID